MARETGRRGFFKEALSQIMQPVAEFLDDRVSGHVSAGAPSRGNLLRPPGAVPEAEFLEKCHRCGNCVKNCPANAIFALAERVQADLLHTPYIDPAEQPCVICDSLACMYVCPSGALQPVYAEDIKIGLAVFNGETCLRTKDVACTYCIDTCPIGADAIRLTADGIVAVIEAGCTGCGVCQYACPTAPKSIVIAPRIAREIPVG